MTRLTIGTALLSAALLAFQPAVAQDYSADTVMATVNGKNITLGHMLAMRARLPEQYQTIPADQLFNGILDQLVDQQVLADTAGEAPRAVRLSLENESRALMAQESIQDILDQPVDEDDVKAAYDAQFGPDTRSDEFNASHILVETEDEAKALIEALDGGADFAELAAEKSTGPSGPNGGSLGWFGMGSMVPPFEAAVIEMEVGSVAGPVETQFGWHVIKLNEKRLSPVPSFEEAEADLIRTINEGSLRAAIDIRREQADVEVLETEVPFDAIAKIELLEE